MLDYEGEWEEYGEEMNDTKEHKQLDVTVK